MIISRIYAILSNAFIEFMLDKIDLTLEWALAQASADENALSIYVHRLLDVMEYDVPYSASQILAALGLKSKETLRKNYLTPAIEKGWLSWESPKNQTAAIRLISGNEWNHSQTSFSNG